MWWSTGGRFQVFKKQEISTDIVPFLPCIIVYKMSHPLSNVCEPIHLPTLPWNLLHLIHRKNPLYHLGKARQWSSYSEESEVCPGQFGFLSEIAIYKWLDNFPVPHLINTLSGDKELLRAPLEARLSLDISWPLTFWPFCMVDFTADLVRVSLF